MADAFGGERMEGYIVVSPFTYNGKVWVEGDEVPPMPDSHLIRLEAEGKVAQFRLKALRRRRKPK